MRPSRRSSGSATIQDVAREAGVSAMTVSRVVNDVRSVRETTRQRVLEAVQRLNYSPNTAARSLAAGEAAQLGLLYSNPSAAYLSLFLVGALEGARRAGCHIVLEACGSELDGDQAQAAERLADTEVQGVVLPPPLSESPAVLDAIIKSGVPFVTVGGSRTVPGGLKARIDDFAAAVAMTNYLLDFGHRRIGFIRGNLNQQVSHERYEGFTHALRTRGIDVSEMAIAQGDFTYRSGLAAAEELLSSNPPPTAIFASNDDMGAAAVNVAHRRGLLVPRDLSVVGFDDTAPATTVWPELTTIRQPVSAIASAALDLLLARIRAERGGYDLPAGERILDYELVVRESAGPAPRASR